MKSGPDIGYGFESVAARKKKYGKTLRQVAAYINARCELLGIEAGVEQWESSTDRSWKGSRLRWPGKGRKGSRIQVWKFGKRHRPDSCVLDHKNSETYRRVDEVLQWLSAWEQGYERVHFGNTPWKKHGCGTIRP